ncbi:MAG: response regulator [Opitutaceae bacterium]|nr:response regulator [Opitutaceae bacterium]MBP9911826.1 response regulator [Opitutaceae bacterium]
MSHPSTKAVVVLDDEKSYADLLSQLLTDSLVCPVHTFNRPFDALAALPDLDVGVVVTDYFMPQLNGIEFIAEASKILPDVPFLIITGHPLKLTDEALARLPTLKAVLPKPFNWQKLTDEIVRYWPEPEASPLRIRS